MFCPVLHRVNVWVKYHILRKDAFFEIYTLASSSPLTMYTTMAVVIEKLKRT